MKKIIILSVSLVITFGLVMTYLIVTSKPKVAVARTISNLVDDINDSSTFELLKDILNNGSIDFGLNSAINEQTNENVLNDSSISGKVYFNKESLMLSNLNLTYGDKKLKGEVYLSKDKCYVKEDVLFNETLGFEISKLKEELNKSIFASFSGSDYSIDKKNYQRIITTLENLENSEEIYNDVCDLIETLLKDIYNIAFETFEIETSSKKEEIDGKNKYVRLIEIKIDNRSVVKFIEEVYKYISETDLIINFLDKYEKIIYKYVGTSFNFISIVTIYKKALQTFGNKLPKIYLDIEKELRPINIKLYTSKLSSKLLKIDCDYDNVDFLNLEFSNNKHLIKSFDFYFNSYHMEYKWYDNIYELIIVDNDFESVFYLDEQKYHITLEINEELGKFKLKNLMREVNLNTTEEYFKIENIYEGTFKKYKDSYFISLDKVINNVENVYIIDSYVSINTNDIMPDPISSFKTIDLITEEEMKKWLYKISSIIDEN